MVQKRDAHCITAKIAIKPLEDGLYGVDGHLCASSRAAAVQGHLLPVCLVDHILFGWVGHMVIQQLTPAK